MAKGQKRSNRETKKPKQGKARVAGQQTKWPRIFNAKSGIEHDTRE